MNCLTRYIAFMALPLLFAACTEVELCEGEEHPHLAVLSFRFNWEEGSSVEGRPDTMLVMANRIINTWRAGFQVEVPKENGGVTNEGETVFGKLITTVDEAADENMPDGDGPDENASETDTDAETPPDEENNPDNSGEENNPGEEGDGPADNGGTATDEPSDNGGENEGEGEGNESGEGDEGDENGTDTPAIPDKLMRIKEGDFQFIAINGNYDECEIERIEEFQTDPTVKAKELYVRYKTYEKADKALEVFGHPWIDYNPYGHFIISAMNPTWYALVPVQTIRAGEDCMVTLTPECVTQKYTIKFNVEKESGVKIDTIIGVLGGIPQRYGMTTRYIDVETTNKMIFVPEADYDSNDELTTLDCTGQVNAIGLVRSKGKAYTQGPGILQLCIYASTERDGQPVRKTFYAIINLYNTISEAKPLVAVDNGTHVVQNGKEILLDIKSVLRIDKNGIIETPDEDNTMDRWKNAGSFNVDI